MWHPWMAIALAALVVSGCAPYEEPELGLVASEPSTTDLYVSLERPRYLVTKRMVELILRNDGEQPVTVDTLQLVSGAFTTVKPTIRDVELEPGRRVDVPVDYGQAVCGDHSEGHAARLAVNGGPPQVWVLEDADDALGLLYSEECHRQAVEAAADITFTDWEQVDDRTVRATLVVQRAESKEPITVDEVRGGVIWSFRTVDPNRIPAIRLARNKDEARVPVQMGITRCDPHGLAESKKTYRWPIYIGLGDADSQYLEVEPTGEGRALLEEMLDRCANG